MATLYGDFYFDPSTGDLDISTGIKIIDSNPVSLRQRLWMSFNVWQGDWYFDISYGFPYRSYVGNKVLKVVLDNRIKETIRQQPDVLSIEDFRSTLDGAKRSYTAYTNVLTTEQEVVRLAFVADSEYNYRVPDEMTSLASLCEDSVNYNGRSYDVVNFSIG